MEERAKKTKNKKTNACNHTLAHWKSCFFYYGTVTVQLALDRWLYLVFLSPSSPLCLMLRSCHLAALQPTVTVFCKRFTESAKSRIHHLSAICPTATNKPYGGCDSHSPHAYSHATNRWREFFDWQMGGPVTVGYGARQEVTDGGVSATRDTHQH